MAGNKYQSIRIPEDVYKNQCLSPGEFSLLQGDYERKNISHEIYLDEITGNPVLVEPGINDPNPAYYPSCSSSQSEDYFKPFFTPFSLPPPEGPVIKQDSYITPDQEYIRPGQGLIIAVYLVYPMNPVKKLAVKNRKTGKEYNIPVPGELPAREEKKFSWDAGIKKEVGAYNLKITGWEGRNFKEIVSGTIIQVVSDTSINLGTITKSPGEKKTILTLKVLSEKNYETEKEESDARRELIMEAIRDTKNDSWAVIRSEKQDPQGKNSLRLLSLNAKLSYLHFDNDGTAKIEPPSPEDLEKLRKINIFIDRIITSDFIEVCLEAGKYQAADLHSLNTFLDRNNLDEFLSLESYKTSNDSYSEALWQYGVVTYKTGANLSGFLYLRNMLNLYSVVFSIGIYKGEPVIKTFPANSKQGFCAVVFSTGNESGESDTAGNVLKKIIDAGKNELRIVSPLLTSAAVVKPGSEFDIYVDIPGVLLGKYNNEVEVIVTENILVHTPADSEKPFKNSRADPLSSYKVRVIKSEGIAAGKFQRFYQGTRDIKIGEYTRTLRSTKEDSHYLNVGIRQKIENPLYIPPDRKEFYLKMYYRGYPGLLSECDHLYRVTVTLDPKPNPGMYLLKVKNTRDARVHPLKVFEQGKTRYTFIQLTDVHTARRYDDAEKNPKKYLTDDEKKRYVNPNASLIKYAKNINNADFVVVTGDLIEYANEHRPYEEDFIPDGNWMFIEEIIREHFKVPLFVCPGNHDYKHNPTPLDAFTSDINLNKATARKYLLDKQGSTDLPGSIVDYFPWAVSRHLEDIFFTDRNALQYYFYNFCPFHDYSFTIDGLTFIFLDSGEDEFRFLSDYKESPAQAWEYLKSVFAGQNPPPMSRGLSKPQIDFIDDFTRGTRIVFMHSALLNPKLSCPDILLLEENISKIEEWKHKYIPNPSEREKLLKMIDTEIQSTFKEIMQKLINIYIRGKAGGSIEAGIFLISKIKEKIKGMDINIDVRQIPGVGIDDVLSLIRVIMKKITDVRKIITEIIQFLITEVIKRISNDIWAMQKDVEEIMEKIKALDEYMHKRGLFETFIFDEASIINNREKLLGMIEEKKIKLVVTGHVHKNLEFTLKTVEPNAASPAERWHCGEYSRGNSLEDRPYVVSTISTGYLGYKWEKKAGDYKFTDIDGYERIFHATGYREFTVTAQGEINSMKIIETEKGAQVR